MHFLNTLWANILLSPKCLTYTSEGRKCLFWLMVWPQVLGQHHSLGVLSESIFSPLWWESEKTERCEEQDNVRYTSFVVFLPQPGSTKVSRSLPKSCHQLRTAHQGETAHPNFNSFLLPASTQTSNLKLDCHLQRSYSCTFQSVVFIDKAPAVYSLQCTWNVVPVNVDVKQKVHTLL